MNSWAPCPEIRFLPTIITSFSALAISTNNEPLFSEPSHSLRSIPGVEGKDLAKTSFSTSIPFNCSICGAVTFC